MGSPWGFLVALPLGLLLAPLVVVISIYSTWSIVALLAFAAAVGAIVTRRHRTSLLAIAYGAAGGVAVALVAFAAVGIFLSRSLSGMLGLVAFGWWWLALAAVAGAGASLLRRTRPSRRAGLLASAAFVFAGGWVAALALTPTSVLTEDPCRQGGGRAACQLYVMCAETAERRRIGTIERVTEFNTAPPRIRCEYYTWGGILIGAVEGDGRGSRWIGP